MDDSEDESPQDVVDDYGAIIIGTITDDDPDFDGLVGLYFRDRAELTIGEWVDGEFTPQFSVDAVAS